MLLLVVVVLVKSFDKPSTKNKLTAKPLIYTSKGLLSLSELLEDSVDDFELTESLGYQEARYIYTMDGMYLHTASGSKVEVIRNGCMYLKSVDELETKDLLVYSLGFYNKADEADVITNNLIYNSLLPKKTNSEFLKLCALLYKYQSSIVDVFDLAIPKNKFPEVQELLNKFVDYSYFKFELKKENVILKFKQPLLGWMIKQGFLVSKQFRLLPKCIRTASTSSVKTFVDVFEPNFQLKDVGVTSHSPFFVQQLASLFRALGIRTRRIALEANYMYNLKQREFEKNSTLLKNKVHDPEAAFLNAGLNPLDINIFWDSVFPVYKAKVYKQSVTIKTKAPFLYEGVFMYPNSKFIL